MKQKKIKLIYALFFLFFSTVYSFSQEVLASFGIGGQFQNEHLSLIETYTEHNNTFYSFYDYQYTGESGVTIGVNILFLGKTGFSISTAIDFIIGEEGIIIDPILGLGYVYYNKYYIGGLINFILRLYFPDLFITPTLVLGYDFGNILLGSQFSAPIGILSQTTGFKFSIVVGVNVSN